MSLFGISKNRESQPILKVKNLNYTFPDGKKILHDINLEVQPGQKVAIIGGNGCGKSTLLMLINGLLIPDSGQVWVNGVEVNRSNSAKVRSMVGLVFQNPDDQLFSTSVFDAVAFGLILAGRKPKEVQQKVAEALEIVHLSGSERRNPFRLSGGEKKKVTLASVIATQPDVVLLDDPTIGLDVRVREEIIQVFACMTPTTLIASQDIEMVRQLTERTLVMADGKMLLDGTTREVLDNQELLKEQGLQGIKPRYS